MLNETSCDPPQCPFCDGARSRSLLANDLSYAIRDGFPVTPMHSLVIPVRHVQDHFQLSVEEVVACYDLLQRLRHEILAEDSTVEGFNIGVNAGVVAGQTVFHCHIHLIPRRKGDVANPRGGVRHLIPGKGSY